MVIKPEVKEVPLLFREILHKEGVSQKVIDFSEGTDFRKTLGVVLVQGDSSTINRLTKESAPRHIVLLLDLKGKKVIGGAIAPWYGRKIEFSESYGLTCSSEDSLYSVRSSLESFLKWNIWGEEPGLEPNLNKNKLEVEFSSYDKFIRRFVSLTDFYLRLQQDESSKTLYGDYIERIESIRMDLQQEIKSILNSYPEEFKDVL